jgi:E3 ubiquitin-protein ligase TRIP12
VDEPLARSLRQLKRAAITKQKIDEDELLSPEQKAAAAWKIRIGDYSVEDLALDFTLPGYPSIELIPNGAHIDVTIDNVGDYIDKVMEYTLGTGVRSQVEAFAAGFSLVFPYAALQAFTPDELVMLFGRVDEDWSLESKSFTCSRIQRDANV